LPSRRTGSGQRVFDRADLDAHLGRSATDKVPVDRVEALYCRVSGKTGQESSLAIQEKMLRESATGVVYRVYKDRGSVCGKRRPVWDRMLDDAAKGHFTVVRVVWRDRSASVRCRVDRRYLSVVGVTVEVLREHDDTSVGEELIDDFMALPASFSGRFYSLRSRLNQRRLLGRCGSTVCGGNPTKTVDTQKTPGSCGSTTTR
jgi:putative resolvase